MIKNLCNKSLVIICLVTAICLMVSGCQSEKNSEKTPMTTTDTLDIKNGYVEEEPIYDCDADEISSMEIDYTPFVDLEMLISEQSFIDEVSRNFSGWSEQSESLLYGGTGIYLSSTPVYAYHLNDEKLASVILCYVFSEDKAKAGEIQICLNGDEVTYFFSYVGTNSGVDKIVETMKESPDTKFIKLYNNRTHTIIDEDSEPMDTDFKMVGDVFHSLNYEFLGVSYNDIIENLVWIELD